MLIRSLTVSECEDGTVSYFYDVVSSFCDSRVHGKFSSVGDFTEWFSNSLEAERFSFVEYSFLHRLVSHFRLVGLSLDSDEFYDALVSRGAGYLDYYYVVNSLGKVLTRNTYLAKATGTYSFSFYWGSGSEIKRSQLFTLDELERADGFDIDGCEVYGGSGSQRVS